MSTGDDEQMKTFDEQRPWCLVPRSRTEWLAGGTRRDELCPPSFRRTSRGHFAPSNVGRVEGQLLTTQRILDAVPLLTPSGALGGWAAAFVQGVVWQDGLDRVGPIAVPVHVGDDTGRSASQVRFIHDVLDAAEILTCHNLRVTNLVRTAFDTIRWARDLGDAVAALDAILRFTALTRDALQVELDQRGGWRGIVQARNALAIADACVLSPWESRLRALYIVEACLPVPLVNPWVFDRSWNLLGRPDLLDRVLAHAIEYDGSYHDDPGQRLVDASRQEAMESAGVVMTRVDRDDFSSHRDLVHHLRCDRTRASGLPLSTRLRVVPADRMAELNGHVIPRHVREFLAATD